MDPSVLQRCPDGSSVPAGPSVSAAFGVLGMNGLTSDYSLPQIGQPQTGDTLVVSMAARAVGSCVGQIARLHGRKTVGISGGQAKRRLCRDKCCFDAAVACKPEDFQARLVQACAVGVGVYFDNTAGLISDAVMAHFNPGACVLICGTAPVSSGEPYPQSPPVERQLLVKCKRMQGSVLFEHAEHFNVARQDFLKWLRAGQRHYVEDILDGVEHAFDAIAGPYCGENPGKRMTRWSQPCRTLPSKYVNTYDGVSC